MSVDSSRVKHLCKIKRSKIPEKRLGRFKDVATYLGLIRAKVTHHVHICTKHGSKNSLEGDREVKQNELEAEIWKQKRPWYYKPLEITHICKALPTVVKMAV